MTNGIFMKIAFPSSILLVSIFAALKMKDTPLYLDGMVNPDWLFRLGIVLFFYSWVLGSILDVPINNETLRHLGIEVPINWRTELMYALMFISFGFMCVSRNIIEFCGSILVLVILEMINLVLIDKNYISKASGNHDNKGYEQILIIKDEIHSLFRGTERKTRNALNIAIPLVIITITIVENTIKKIVVPIGIKIWVILFFIVFSESWMMKIRLRHRRRMIALKL